MDQQRSAAAGGGRTSRRTRLRVPVVVASALAMLAAPTTASAQALEDPFGGGDYTFATTDFGGEDPFAPLSTTGGSSFEAGAGFTTAPVEPFTFGAADAEELLDLSGPIEFGTTPAGTADLFAPGSSSTPSLSLPWDGGAAAGAAPTVQTDALRAEMQRWQRDLQAEGVIAHSAAEVFNNHQAELSSRFGLSAQQATEALGGSYSNRVGQRLVGPATVGPAIVGEGLVGEGIVGQGIVGEGLVGPCLDASCPNWGEIAGFGATAPAAGGQPGGTLPGGTLPEAVTRTPGGSTTTPAPSGTQPAPVPLPVPGIDAIPSAPPAQSPQEGGGEGTAAAPNPFRAPIYAATGAGFSYLLNRGIQPDLGQVPESTIAARLAPNIARGAVQDYVFAGGLPPINTGDPWTSAIANGCQGAAATQCMLFGSRRVLNPGVDSIIANQRANAGADALIDPRTVTLSPNASLNIPQGRTPDSPWTNPSALDAAEFLPASGTTPEINPNTFADPGVRFDPVFGLPRLGTPPGATDPAVEYSIADMQAFTPEQRQFTQRVTDGTILGINLAAPLLSTATDQTLRALGQEDNYALNVGAQAVFGAGLPVGVPISLAQGRIVRGAFVYPTVQSVIARTASDALIGLAPASVGQALSEACSDDNPVVNAAAGLACNLGQNPNQQPPVAPPPNTGGAPVTATSTVTTAALQAEMQRWQRDLQADGVIAHSAAEVFNNHQQELSSRFGLSAQQATEALGGSYSNRVGQRITGPAIVGPAIVGPAIVGPKIVGPAIVGPGIVGEGIVGPCLDASCPNWGRINGFASAPSAPSAVTSGGSAPVWNPPAVRAPAGGSRVQPAPAAPAAPSAVRRPEHDTVAAPRPRPQPQQQPNWVQQAGQAAWDVLTYPHPLDPVRGAWRDAWRYLPGIGPAGQREFAH